MRNSAAAHIGAWHHKLHLMHLVFCVHASTKQCQAPRGARIFHWTVANHLSGANVGPGRKWSPSIDFPLQRRRFQVNATGWTCDVGAHVQGKDLQRTDYYKTLFEPNNHVT